MASRTSQLSYLGALWPCGACAGMPSAGFTGSERTGAGLLTWLTGWDGKDCGWGTPVPLLARAAHVTGFLSEKRKAKHIQNKFVHHKGFKMQIKIRYRESYHKIVKSMF